MSFANLDIAYDFACSSSTPCRFLAFSMSAIWYRSLLIRSSAFSFSSKFFVSKSPIVFSNPATSAADVASWEADVADPPDVVPEGEEGASPADEEPKVYIYKCVVWKQDECRRILNFKNTVVLDEHLLARR